MWAFIGSIFSAGEALSKGMLIIIYTVNGCAYNIIYWQGIPGGTQVLKRNPLPMTFMLIPIIVLSTDREFLRYYKILID